MDIISWLIGALDSFLIMPYRWPANPVLGWWVGSSVLALWSTFLGEISVSIAYKANRFRIKEMEKEMVARHHQSINALKSGDKRSYKAINRLANEAYGQSFFMQLAMAGAFLWPIPFALGWLHTRFAEVRFPLPVLETTVSYTFVFIPLFILIRIAYGNVKRLFKRTV